MRTLYLCGAGNPEGVRLAMVVNRTEKRWDRFLVLDDDSGRHGQQLLGAEIAGGITEMLAKADPKNDSVVNLVGRTTSGRSKVRNKLLESGVPFTKLIHPRVETLGVTFGGDDVIIYENATLCGDSTIGQGSVVFMNAVVGHGSTVKECAVVGPGSVLNARAVLSDRAYFGTNASILPDLTIGEDATVGANSAVMENVPAGASAIGVPAQLLMPMKSEVTSETSGAAPRAPGDEKVTRAIRQIWQEVLGLSAVPDDANFFDIGGSSLLALLLQVRTQEDLGKPVALLDIFRYPTIDSLSSFLSNSRHGVGNDAAKIGAERAAIRRRRRAQRW